MKRHSSPRSTGPLLASSEELFELINPAPDPRRPDLIRRFDLDARPAGPLRIAGEMRTERVTGPQGIACAAFFNVEYETGPVFWDAFFYPETGTTPWRPLCCEVRARGPIRCVELHLRLQAKGRLQLRQVRLEAIDPWPEDAELAVAIFGDSTDMTCYLPTELRLGRRLDLLLRDRFPDRRIDVHCLAEGGEFLQRLLDSGKLERELAILPRCDFALIRYGLNDEAQKIDPAAFGAQLHTACDAIGRRFPQCQVVLATTIPPKAEAYNEQTRAVAAARGLPLIRLDQFLRRRSAAGDSDWHHQPGSRIGRGRESNPPNNPDGLQGDLHPNAHGADLIAGHYFECLEPLAAQCLEPRP